MKELPVSWFRDLPKVELHFHIEGAIPLPALWNLVCKYGGDPAVPDMQSLEHRFVYRDFMHFIDTWFWKNSFLRELEDLEYIAQAVAEDLASQNIHYVEAFYSPRDFDPYGMSTQDITAAFRRGLDRVPQVTVKLVADLVRNYGAEKAAETLEMVREVKDLGVIGIGIGGPEDGYPPEPFAAVYERARRYGFHTNAHAGEAAGAGSIWGAVQALKVERIGHGTRAWEDEKLLDLLGERQIPLEMCPISNLCTAVVRTIEEHPVRCYFDRGLLVTVNTDDPKMFNNSLVDEYRLLNRTFGFTAGEIRQLIRNAIHASWMDAEEKQKLEKEFLADPSWQAEV